MNYYLARGCCVRVRPERMQAIEYLRMALNEGFTNARRRLPPTGSSPSLRGIPAFEQLLAAQKSRP
jgi:hypothetical protein